MGRQPRPVVTDIINQTFCFNYKKLSNADETAHQSPKHFIMAR